MQKTPRNRLDSISDEELLSLQFCELEGYSLSPSQMEQWIANAQTDAASIYDNIRDGVKEEYNIDINEPLEFEADFGDIDDISITDCKYLTEYAKSFNYLKNNFSTMGNQEKAFELSRLAFIQDRIKGLEKCVRPLLQREGVNLEDVDTFYINQQKQITEEMDFERITFASLAQEYKSLKLIVAFVESLMSNIKVKNAEEEIPAVPDEREGIEKLENPLNEMTTVPYERQSGEEYDRLELSKKSIAPAVAIFLLHKQRAKKCRMPINPEGNKESILDNSIACMGVFHATISEYASIEKDNADKLQERSPQYQEIVKQRNKIWEMAREKSRLPHDPHDLHYAVLDARVFIKFLEMFEKGDQCPELKDDNILELIELQEQEEKLKDAEEVLGFFDFSSFERGIGTVKGNFEHVFNLNQKLKDRMDEIMHEINNKQSFMDRMKSIEEEIKKADQELSDNNVVQSPEYRHQLYFQVNQLFQQLGEDFQDIQSILKNIDNMQVAIETNKSIYSKIYPEYDTPQHITDAMKSLEARKQELTDIIKKYDQIGDLLVNLRNKIDYQPHPNKTPRNPVPKSRFSCLPCLPCPRLPKMNLRTQQPQARATRTHRDPHGIGMNS